MGSAPSDPGDELAAGDPRALEALLGEHASELRAFVRLRSGALLRSMESTSDLVQSVYREILEHRERFRFPDQDGFRRWLFATAARKVQHRVEYYRAQKRDPARVAPLDVSDDLHAVLAHYASFCTPSAALRTQEEVRRIESAFDRLPEHYREAITLHRVAGLPLAAVADLMGRSEDATRVLFYRALDRLAVLLQEPA